MTNEQMRNCLTIIGDIPIGKAQAHNVTECLVAELVRRELARSQPKPVEEESTFEESPKWPSESRLSNESPTPPKEEERIRALCPICQKRWDMAVASGQMSGDALEAGATVEVKPKPDTAPPKRDYGRERAEKMVTPLPDSETFSGGEVVRMHGMGMDFKARCPYASWMVDFLAGVASAARADGIEEAAKMLDEYTYSVLSDAVRKLK